MTFKDYVVRTLLIVVSVLAMISSLVYLLMNSPGLFTIVMGVFLIFSMTYRYIFGDNHAKNS